MGDVSMARNISSVLSAVGVLVFLHVRAVVVTNGKTRKIPPCRFVAVFPPPKATYR